MIPARYANVLFSLILSGLMSLMVSGLSTVKALGPIDGIVVIWLRNWLSCWGVAFVTALLLAPHVRRLVDLLIKPRKRIV